MIKGNKRARAKYRICRRLGENLWNREKDPTVYRNYPCGMHRNSGYKKGSGYKMQLSAKSRLKSYYNIKEKQLYRIYKDASSFLGNTGELMVQILESMLISVVYHGKLAPTIFAARQMISHGHILVNGKPLTISSARVSVGDVISVKSTDLLLYKQASEDNKRMRAPYLEPVNDNPSSLTFASLPEMADVPYNVDMQITLVIEFYSR